MGWAIGGGLAGFFGWGLLGLFGWWLQPSLQTVTFGLGLACGSGSSAMPILDRSSIRPDLSPEGGRMLWIPALLIVGFPAYLWLAGSRATDVRLATGSVASRSHRSRVARRANTFRGPVATAAAPVLATPTFEVEETEPNGILNRG